MDHSTLILVVDDDPDLRKLIGDFLAGHGYRVEAAANAAAMRASIENQRPDLVILDMQIGNMGGVAVALDLRLEESAGRLDRANILLLLDREADLAEGHAEALMLAAPRTLEEEIAELRVAERVDAELEAMKQRRIAA